MASFDYITETGVIIPDTADIKEDVQSEFKAALGNDINLSDSTPQGRLIDAITQSRMDTIRTCAAIANMLNPNLAYGSFLDAICALTGCVRRQASRSSVVAVLGGTPGTTIPAGNIAVTAAGDEFYLENSATLGVDGTAEAIFLSVQTGAIPCGVGELSQIQTTVLGWETITNNVTATLGQEVEGDTELKMRRLNTLYQGRGFSASVVSALANVPNLKSSIIRHNYKSQPLIIDGLTIKPHSVYVCAYGGTDSDVAKALFNTVPVGCDYSGSTIVSVTDEYTQQTYDIAFERPSVVEIDVKIYLRKDSGTGDVQGAVKSAIQKFVNGEVPNIDGMGIGVDLSPFEIASAINIEVPGVFVNQVQIAKHNGTLSTNSIEMKINEIANISDSNISVRIQS
jgi:uncharacterized phage protein gp47/JayE